MSNNSQATSTVLSRAIFQLLMEEPFYAHFVQGFQREISVVLPTAAVMAVNGEIKLVVNPEFFIHLPTPKQQVGLLKHELLHVVFHHLFRNERKQCSDFVYNLAADQVVNQC